MMQMNIYIKVVNVE